jgi:hypothetical protein
MEESRRYRPKLWYHIDSTDLPTVAGLLTRQEGFCLGALEKLDTESDLHFLDLGDIELIADTSCKYLVKISS